MGNICDINYIYIARDSDSKTITDSKIITNNNSEYLTLCGNYNSRLEGDIEFKIPGGYAKEKDVLIRYCLYNVFVLLSQFGFSIGEAISLKTLFLSPFMDGHQFLYHYPAWFVPVLFLIETINVCMRRVLKQLRLDNDWLIMGGLLLCGVLTVWLAIGGHVWGYYKIPGRILFMLPGFQMGRIYKEKLEKHDTLPSSVYLAIVMGVQIMITIVCAGLAFSAVWVSSFANGPLVPYLTVITGIAFWLRISKVVAKLPGIAEHMILLGRNTFSLMMHHTMGFMLVKMVFYFISIATPFCSEFDVPMFFSEINFIYLAGGSEASKWIYVIAGISFSLLMAGLQHKITDTLFPTRRYRTLTHNHMHNHM